MRDQLLRELENIEERLGSFVRDAIAAADDDACAAALIARERIRRTTGWLRAHMVSAPAGVGAPATETKAEPEPKRRGRKPKQTSLLPETKTATATTNGNASNVRAIGDMPPREAP